MTDTIPNLSLIWVGLGGGIGAMLRYYLGLKIKCSYQGNFPLATFIVNISGAFLLAFLSAALAADWQIRYGTFLHELVLTGILGGYTTFSSMQVDALTLFEKEKNIVGLFYLLITLVSGFIGAALGFYLAKTML